VPPLTVSMRLLVERVTAAALSVGLFAGGAADCLESPHPVSVSGKVERQTIAEERVRRAVMKLSVFYD
jgi:hypothetical protein